LRELDWPAPWQERRGLHALLRLGFVGEDVVDLAE
jgi:hypothetical protein